MSRSRVALVALLLAAGCEGRLYFESAAGDGPPPDLPRVVLDGGVADGGGGGLELCTLPPEGECAGDVARWCEGTSTREESCDDGCAMDAALGRHACGAAGEPPPGEPPPEEPPPEEPPPTEGCGTAIEQEVIALANQSRGETGAGPLTCDDDMTRAARKHSQDMCDQGYFSHTGLDGRSPFDRMRDEGVSYRTAGENIAQGQQSPASVHNAWMNSSGHRANILNGSFGRIGVGHVECGGRHYWTQVFAD